MHSTTYQPDALTLAERLTAGARTPEARAALTLLLSMPTLYTRRDVLTRWYDDRLAGHHPPIVRWDQVAADADRGMVPMSTGERAALLLASSIAGRQPVVLADVLGYLDHTLAATLVVALHHLVAPPVTPAAPHQRHAGAEDR